MSVVKSKFLNEFSKNYPNFPKKDLKKFTDIILNEIKNSIKRKERVELRNFGIFYSDIQKKSIRRNPKTGEKVFVPQKNIIKWRMSKEIFKKLNDE